MAEFNHHDPVHDVNFVENQTIYHHPDLKRRWVEAMKEADDGEIMINIPRGITIEPVVSLHMFAGQADAQFGQNNGMFDYAPRDNSPDTPGPMTPGPMTPGGSTPTTPGPAPRSYTPLTVRIEFELKNPTAGINYVHPDAQTAPHVCLFFQRFHLLIHSAFTTPIPSINHFQRVLVTGCHASITSGKGVLGRWNLSFHRD